MRLPSELRLTSGLRVAIVSPPWYPVPPEGYGGIELVVYLLARELQAKGHAVTVFTCEGSSPQFQVEALAPKSWTSNLGDAGPQRYRDATYALRAYRRIKAGVFDVIHDHTDCGSLAVAAALDLKAPVVATVHGPLDEPSTTFFQELEGQVHLVSISKAQAASASLRWRGTVHNAVDTSGLIVGVAKEDRLLQLARICPDKGQHLAIEVARRVGLPLTLAGKIEPTPLGRRYFAEMIEPHLGKDVTWIDNVQGAEKAELLAGARAMLFPIQWEEPFGLAMVEAMVSGTPVIAMRRGAAPELIDEDRTGFLADDVDGLVAAFDHLDEIDPAGCARLARQRFSPDRMARGYEKVYMDSLGVPIGARSAVSLTGRVAG